MGKRYQKLLLLFTRKRHNIRTYTRIVFCLLAEEEEDIELESMGHCVSYALLMLSIVVAYITHYVLIEWKFLMLPFDDQN